MYSTFIIDSASKSKNWGWKSIERLLKQYLVLKFNKMKRINPKLTRKPLTKKMELQFQLLSQIELTKIWTVDDTEVTWKQKKYPSKAFLEPFRCGIWIT